MADPITKAYMQEVVLFEELTINEESDADRMKESGRDWYLEQFHKQHPQAQELFTRYKDKVPFRARMPVSFEEKVTAPHQAVTGFLTHHGYEFTDEDYKNGVAHATKVVGDPERGIPFTTKKVTHKISGLLDKHDASDEIKKNFVNDPYRIGAKTKQFDLIITANHKDIYGGSTGRGWTSCADKRPRPHDHPLGFYDGKGPAAQCIPEEINNLTHMVYLVPHGADLDTSAIGRASYKMHEGVLTGHKTVLPEPVEYGTPPKEFKPAADKVMAMLFPKKPGEIYQKNDKVYNDGSPKFVFPTESVSGEQLDAVYKKIPKKDEWTRAELHTHINPNEKYKTHEARDIAKAMNNFSDTIAGVHSKHEPENQFQHALTAAAQLDSSAPKTQMYLAENPHVKEMADKAAALFDINRQDHASAIVNTRYPNDVTRMVITRATKHLKAKNYHEFKHMKTLSDRGIYFEGESYKIPIAEKHQMGKDPFDHLVKSAADNGELTRELMTSIYHAAAGKSKRTGNIFDHAIQYEREGVPGMSKVVNDLAANKVKSAGRGWGGMSRDDELGRLLYLSKPQHRERLASAFNVGMTHQEIMKSGKKGVDSEKEIRKMIRDKKKTQLSEEYGVDFEYDDSEYT
jgi:hypothetical protein